MFSGQGQEMDARHWTVLFLLLLICQFPDCTATTTSTPTPTIAAPATAASTTASTQTTPTTTTAPPTTSPSTTEPTTTVSLEDKIQPTNLNIVSVNSTSLTISWQHNYTVSNLSVSYSVKAISNDTSSIVNCTLGPRTTAVCSGVTPGNRYHVMVTATSGSDSRSETYTIVTDTGQPGPLTNSSTYLAHNVTLYWGQAPGKVDFYILYVDGTQKYNGSTTSCNVTGLEPGTLYQVTILAYSYNMPGINRTDSFTTQVIEPDPPTDLKVKSTTTTSVELTWQPPQITGGTLTGYRVCHSGRPYLDLPESAPTCTHTNRNSSVVTYSVTGLTAGGFYTFDVNTENTQFNSTQSASTSTQTNETVPGIVTPLKVMPQVHGNLHVYWQRPSSPNGNITGYEVAWTEQGDTTNNCSVHMNNSRTLVPSCANSSENVSTTDEKSFEYLITNLKASTYYTITVTAFTAEGEGALQTHTALTSVDIPGNVTNVQADVFNATSINVTWEIPGSNPGPTNYTATAVDASPLQLSNLTRTCTAIDYTSVSCVIDGLEEYWQYNISVAANTSAGPSSSVYMENITRTSEGVPGQAQDLHVQTYLTSPGCDATQVTFIWSNPEPLARNALINLYKIEIFHGGVSQGSMEHRDEEAADNVYSSRRHFQQNYKHLSAEVSYTWKVTTLIDTSTSIHGKGTHNFTTGACPPPGWQPGYNNISAIGSTTQSVMVNLERRFFQDKSQGAIEQQFLIVNRRNDDNMDVRLDLIRSYESTGNFARAYKIAIAKHEVDKGVFEIGSEVCDSTRDPCTNGPLPAAFIFYVRAVTCTAANCTASGWFGPFQTQDNPEEIEFPMAAVLIPLVLIVLVGLTLGALWYKGVTPFQRKPSGEEGDSLTNVPKGRPFVLSGYANTLDNLHKDTNLLFSEQYEDIGRLGKLIEQQSTIDHANMEENKPKNRYVNILPFDHSRVKLQQLDDDDPTSDYINANYMPGFTHKREYIASQGPLPGTMDDFWRMVWEQNTRMIIMLTQCKEGNRVKCEQYWPSDLREPKQYGDIVVNLISLSTLDKYNISIFSLTVNHQTRQVMHFHYLDFPDFSANVQFDLFIEFVKTVRNHVPHDNQGPIIVHCSAGVGRTGTYMAIDRLYEYLRSPEFSFDDKVDIFNIVVSMRENRVSMVQTESQYVMIHDCFLQLVEAKKIEMLANLSIDSDDNLYANQGFEPYPEVLYENVNSKDIKLEIKDNPYENEVKGEGDEIQTEL